MATNKTLSPPKPRYRKFVDNQVLTNDQLNAVIDHLNYQDQLSRVLLSGVGIVCGCNISLTDNGIHLSPGVAVTTDGNLLKTKDTVYKGFKLFGDSNVKYSRFIGEGDTTIPLWELEIEPDSSDEYPLSTFESKTGFTLTEAIAVLYIEDYLKEEENCSPVDCDTQGQEVINRLRVLLISPEDIDELIEGDTIFSNYLTVDKDAPVPALSRLYTPRVVLTEVNTDRYSDFKKAYDVSFSDLAERINNLGSIALFSNIFENAGLDPSSALSGFTSNHTNFQYLYDFYKDLVTAYNELQSLFNKNYSLCCPDTDSFPKHVLLGSLVKEESTWRHRFYPSPAHHHSNSISELRKYFSRLLLMVKNFKPETKEDIVITPSRSYDELLGRRAIPFYYDLEESDNPALFYDKWDGGEDSLIPNYYGFNYPDEDFNPLDVCLDDHDFYRIEGHIGKQVMVVHENIQKTRKEKGLAFDILPVAIGQYPDEATIDYDKYRVYFEDLQVVLEAWNEEIKCITESASRFLSGFSLAEPGVHIGYQVAEIDEVAEEINSNLGLMGTARLFSAKEESSPSLPFQLFAGTFNKTTAYRKDNAVLGGITKKEGTLGAGMIAKDTIKTGYDKAKVIYNTQKELESNTINWTADVKEAAFQMPVDLLGYLKETEDYKLTDIEDFTEENLQKYIKALQAQCKQTKNSQKKLRVLVQKENSVLSSRNWINDYRYVLRRITTACCFIKKVKVLYEKILERKKMVLEQMVLNHFIAKHPGAEHKAGTHKGGTFILLYYSTQQEPERDIVFTEATTAGITEAELELLKPMATISKPAFTISELSSQPHMAAFGRSSIPISRRADLLERFRGRFARLPIFENIPHGTVIGDLCLPYICCSGVPATTFVFPEQLATLRLPVDHVCIGQGEEEQADLIPMDVVPSDGDVKAFVQKQELDGVIIQQENGTFFNPNQVSPADYGKIIRFEVNSQAVEPYLIILAKPEAAFAWSAKVNPDTQNTIATVVFENTSKPFEDLSFEWNFNGEIVRDENAIKFSRPFKVKPGQINEFDVKLTAFNARCSDAVSNTISIDVPAIEEPGPKACYSPEVLKCWGLNNIQTVLRLRKIPFTNLNETEMIDALLKSLRKTGGFTEEELKSVFEDIGRRRKLLACLEISFTEDTSYEDLGNLIRSYQKENCGQQIAVSEVDIDARIVDVNDLNALAKARNVPFVDSRNKTDLTNALTATESGNVFTEDELSLLRNDTIKKVLDSKDITFTANDNKETLTRKLIEGSDDVAAGVKINTEVLDVSEFNNVLSARDVAVVDTENKEDLLNVLNVTGNEITLKSGEVKLLKNDTLRNALDAKGVSFGVNDNKNILAGRLLSG